ncbi:putative leucine-rich repeat receptor-like serine/threonine-protein kinase [Heracleum sosnowskyi]|uniref:non-specific serine/threonine protein kinase n=1 Tax=Heracleum sosnowskyi TaxID=360622 RepID=A0AAD8JBJ0_9APIA|nr:putative leucine-rich repeat receptor-like serine/threonine-protein kinase [Heracleum sosnowskyi]
MRLFKCFVPLTLVYLALIAAIVHSQDDQSGSIHIDCGIPGNSNYTDSTTGINYVSDSGFTDAGESKTILPIYRTITPVLPQEVLTLRSFPGGIRNCYTLKPVQGPGNRYFIRAWFFYGNYDSKGQAPKFDIYLGVEKWDTVSFNQTVSRVLREIIHVPTSEYIHVCLVNTGHGTPFISSLDLRYFNNSMYTAEFGSLYLFSRLDYGGIFAYYRYKDDIYDRLWNSFDEINTSSIYDFEVLKDYAYDGAFEVPTEVMRSAIAPENTSNPLKITWEPRNASDQFLIYLHYAEVQTLQRNQTREFNIYLNGNLWYNRPISPFNRSTGTLYSTEPENQTSNYEILIQKTKRSTLPPIINAIELFTVRQFLQSQTDDQDAGSIMDIKSVYKVQKENWQGDPCAPRAYAWDGVGCSYNGSDLPRITSLNLSSSGLSGKIAPSLSNLTMLRSLDLSNNNLSGDIPDFLAQLTFLRILNIKGNNFTGSVPLVLLSKSKSGFLTLSMDSSLGGGDTNQCLSSSCNQSSNKSLIRIAASVVSVLVLILIALIIILWIRRRRKRQAHLKDNSLETIKRRFTYSEILKLTNNFEKIVGKGGFGTVYHGYIGDTQVAVKMLSPTSVQGYKEFQTEATLVGYCNEDNHLGIIYEYMANGDLEGHLAGKRSNVLSWEQRILIATDAAEGFEYLHHGCKPPIIHRDVKSTNILLTENFQGKLADFGLSRVIPFEAGSHITTVVSGTPGYLDPQYYRSNRLTEKSDVYSFGIVLLEMITGRPAIGTGDDHEHIVEWVRSRIEEGDVRILVDSRIRQNVDVNSVWKALEIALACVSIASDDRPTMNFVATQLKECLETELQTRKKELVGVMSLNIDSDVSSPQAR